MPRDGETTASIAAMLRRLAKGEELPTDEIPSFSSLADRIEAANRREAAELKRYRLKMEWIIKRCDSVLSGSGDCGHSQKWAQQLARDILVWLGRKANHGK